MELPKGTILLCTGSIPSGWSILNSAYHNAPIIGWNTSDINTYSTPSKYGGSTHTHSSPTTSGTGSFSHNHTMDSFSVSHSGGGDTASGPKGLGYPSHTLTASVSTVDSSHAHSLSITVGNASTTPPYKTAILIVKD